MTIALFSDSYLPTKSGIVTVVMQLREQLLQNGIRVVLVVPYTTDEYKTNDKDIYQIKSRPLGMGTDQFFTYPNMKDIIQFLKDRNVDLVHCHTEFNVSQAGIKAAKALGVPVIATLHTMWEDFYKYYLPMANLIPVGLIRFGVKMLYRKFFAFIAVSTKAKNYFDKKFMLPKIPSVIIPNSIDEEKFNTKTLTKKEKESLREKYNISKDDKVILFLGRIAEEKRVLELINVGDKIFSQYKNAKLIFVGSGPALEQVKEKASKSKYAKNFVFTGFIDWVRVSEFYSIADVFVSISLSEMHSMTVLEAIISDVPIVVRHEESYLDTVENGVDGYLENTDEEVANRIVKLLKDEKELKALSKNCKKVASKFSISNYTKNTIKVYEKILKTYPNKISEEELNRL